MVWRQRGTQPATNISYRDSKLLGLSAVIPQVATHMLVTSVLPPGVSLQFEYMQDETKQIDTRPVLSTGHGKCNNAAVLGR